MKEPGDFACFLAVRKYADADRHRVQNIRHRAFQPVFASFKRMVGDEIYQSQHRDIDEKQAAYLDAVLSTPAGKEAYVLTLEDVVIGFLVLFIDSETATGEIDLNAVDPDYQNRGAGEFMYSFAVERFRKGGATVARVATGGDSSHEPARRAYARAGFKAAIPSVTLYQQL